MISGKAPLNEAVLIDSLVEVIDDVRGALNSSLGTRQWRLFSVVRTTRPDGSFVEHETEILPVPLIEPVLDYRLEPCGLDEAGILRVSEVSLSYTHAELTGGSLGHGQSHLFRVVDQHGQATPTRDFVHRRPPHPDRIKNIGWSLELQVARSSVVPGEEGDMAPVYPQDVLTADLGALNVDGTAPAVADYIVPAGKRAVIQRLHVLVRCAADPVADGFGNLASLANGVKLQILETDLSVLLDLSSGSPIQSNEDWLLLGGATLDVAADAVYVQLTLASPIQLAAAQRFRATIQDNLSSLQDFRVRLIGYTENA